MVTAEAEVKIDGSGVTGSLCCAKQSQSDEIIRNHVYGAAGAGLIPIPILDLAGLLAIQINMLRRLSDVYGVPFRQEIAKSSIGALTASVAPLALAAPVASFLKLIPLIGTTTSAVSMSITGGASTYALGKVFTQHFASGGTFLDFNPAAVREYFSQQYQEGKTVAQNVKKQTQN